MPTPPHKKMYAGDSVYIEFDGYSLILTTENGLPTDPSNRIVVEPEVWHSIQQFVAKCKEHYPSCKL